MSRTENKKDMCFIYQLKEEAERLLFLSSDKLRIMGEIVDKNNYELVYSEEYKGLDLKEIYTKFNISVPEDFKGHSLSVSDIVVLRRNGADWAYYVDDIGFKEVSLEFLIDIEEYAAQAENRYVLIQRTDDGWEYSICDKDFGLLDGGVLENEEYCLREALHDILQECLNDDFLKGGMMGETAIERVDIEWVMERMEEAENAKFQALRYGIKTPESICEYLEKRGYPAEVQKVVKNGVEKAAVVIRDENTVVSPVIYLENLICSVRPLEEVVNEIISIHERHKNVQIDVKDIWKKENVLANVRIGLQKAGKELLVKKSGFPMAEMEAYLYLTGELGTGESYSIKVSQDSFKNLLRVSLDELWKAAETNTFADVWLCPLNEMLRSYEQDIGDSLVDIYVLTNEKNYKGASQILNECYLRAFVSQKCGSKKMIAIPSSIHEFLIFPFDESCGDSNPRHITDMVRAVNDAEVVEEERLSDYAYILDFSDEENISWKAIK